MIKDLIQKYGEIIRYVIVGVLTTVVSLGVYYVLVLTVLNPDNAIQLQIANVVSWIAAVTFSYFASRIYVFKSENQNVLKEAVDFYVARLATLLMDMFFMFLFVTAIGLDDKIMKIVVQFIIMVSNYVLSKFFVFRKKDK